MKKNREPVRRGGVRTTRGFIELEQLKSCQIKIIKNK